jgi:hypothetical protein
MTIAPVFFGQFLHQWYTWPLVLPWLLVVFVVALIGMPAVLRAPLAPRRSAQIVEFCDRGYWIVVTDPSSRKSWRIDQAIVGLVVVTAVLRALAWLWLADTDLDKGVVLEGISEAALSDDRGSASLSISSGRLTLRRASNLGGESDLGRDSIL